MKKIKWKNIAAVLALVVSLYGYQIYAQCRGGCCSGGGCSGGSCGGGMGYMPMFQPSCPGGNCSGGQCGGACGSQGCSCSVILPKATNTATGEYTLNGVTYYNDGENWWSNKVEKATAAEIAAVGIAKPKLSRSHSESSPAN